MNGVWATEEKAVGLVEGGTTNTLARRGVAVNVITANTTIVKVGVTVAPAVRVGEPITLTQPCGRNHHTFNPRGWNDVNLSLYGQIELRDGQPTWAYLGE